MKSFYEIQLDGDSIDSLDFDSKPDLAVMNIYRILKAGHESMEAAEPDGDFMMFVRLPLVAMEDAQVDYYGD